MSNTITPRTVREVIYQGDDLDRLEELDEAAAQAEVALRRAERAAKVAERRDTLTLDEVTDHAGTVDAATEARDLANLERDMFAAEAQERGVLVVLRPVLNREWRRLVRAHPPRRGEDGEFIGDDGQFNVNMDEFPYVALPATIDDEASSIEGPVDDFLESLSSYDFDRLTLRMMQANRQGSSADPTQRVASPDQ